MFIETWLICNFLTLHNQRYVSEDVEPGTVLLQTKATDADSGNFAVVEYSLVDGEGKFGITPLMVSQGQSMLYVHKYGRIFPI